MRPDFSSESGGITAVVAIFTSTFLLFGLISLVVDSGVVYLERRTVVNAAQSASLAMARECIERPTTCAQSTIAQEYANANSEDGTTSVAEICINGRTPVGNDCRVLTSHKIDCAPVSTTAGRYVRIRTQSMSNEENIGVRTFFSKGTSQTLQGCAQARWGNASSAAVYAPFAVSICEWSRQQSLPRVLTEYTSSGGTADCQVSFQDYAGVTYTKSGINGWATLDLRSASLPSGAASNVDCPNPNVDQPAYLRIGYELSPLINSQTSQTFCGDTNLSLKMAPWLNQTLYIPLVSTVKLSGNSTIHRIEAFAAFKLLGYALLKGQGNASSFGGTYPAGNWCPKNNSCIYGEFIATFSPNSEISDVPGTPNVGLQAIELF